MFLNRFKICIVVQVKEKIDLHIGVLVNIRSHLVQGLGFFRCFSQKIMYWVCHGFPYGKAIWSLGKFICTSRWKIGNTCHLACLSLLPKTSHGEGHRISFYDTHENVDEHWGIGVDAGRNWEILFESCLTVRHQVHEFGAGIRPVEQRKTKNVIGHNRNAAFPRWLSIYL